MGVDAHNLALLAHAQDLGVRYARTLGVGRQAVFVDGPDLERIRALRGAPRLEGDAAALRYFEPLMRRWFGAEVVDSVDASPYEQATLVHDMNLPWPKGRGDAERYDAVLDFGCLEHVFDFKTAWRNCVDACRVGGHVLHALPANNLCGHGFYQFSPELFFNLYREENGFVLSGLWLAMKADYRSWWRVADPRVLGRRVRLHNASETYLLVVAKKLADHEIATPQQSDYALGAWRHPLPLAGEGGGEGGDTHRPSPQPSPASARGATALLRGLRRLDAARSAREVWRASRRVSALPFPDYERVDVAALLRRGSAK